MTLTARQARKLDPLRFILITIRSDAGQYIARVKKIVAAWPRMQ